MTHLRGPKDDQNSFNLTENSRQGNRATDPLKSPVPTWQEHAYDRLKVLYATGKLLASFDHIEPTFPEILSLCLASFPFQSAVLIRRKVSSVATSMWSSSFATPEQIERSGRHAREAFIFLTAASAHEAHELRETSIVSKVLPGVRSHENQLLPTENFFVLPLAVDHLPAFGVLQLEGSGPLNEDDLEFVSALADLFAIGIDRVNKAYDEQSRRDNEARESSSKLVSSEAHVVDLESERAMRETFVSLLTHDLRTPLTSIRMNAQLIKLHAEAKPERLPAFAGRIISSVDRVDQMITDLLDANSLRIGGELSLHREYFDLSALLRHTVTELATNHGERFVFNEGTEIFGHWDRKGVRRIIENLCNNAIKYGDPDREIVITSGVNDDQAWISILNFGNPIPVADQQSIFLPFNRTAGAKGGLKKGWGIGLTLVLVVTKAHGGTVNLESDLVSGTKFTITLPIVPH